MDFNTVKIYLYNTTISKSVDMDSDNWISEAVEMFISSKGHHLSECHYMFSEDVIEVINE